MNRFVAIAVWMVGCPAATQPTGTPISTPTEVPADCVTPDEGVLDGRCELADRLGGFVVEEQEDFTVVSGSIADSVLPLDVMVEVQGEGDCVLLQRPTLFCAPACGAGETCDGDTCIPYPTSTDVGQVFISGLDTCADMTPAEPGFNYFFNGLGQPGMQPGDLVQLDAPGLSLHGRGVEPIVSPTEEWVMVEDQDLTLTWTAGTVPEARVLISLSIDQHGSSPLRLDCDFGDAGSGTVPASIVNGLILSGVSGFPAGKITRRTADSQSHEDGCVDLMVGSARPHDLSVQGFTPCIRTEDCPEPQVCDLPNEICVDP